jgi:hypothetical protein
MTMFYSQNVQSMPKSWRMYKVHLVMQPHGFDGFDGSFRSRLIKTGYKIAHVQVIYNDVLFSNCTECAHILEDLQSSSCDAATWL